MHQHKASRIQIMSNPYSPMMFVFSLRYGVHNQIKLIIQNILNIFIASFLWNLIVVRSNESQLNKNNQFCLGICPQLTCNCSIIRQKYGNSLLLYAFYIVILNDTIDNSMEGIPSLKSSFNNKLDCSVGGQAIESEFLVAKHAQSMETNKRVLHYMFIIQSALSDDRRCE